MPISWCGGRSEAEEKPLLESTCDPDELLMKCMLAVEGHGAIAVPGAFTNDTVGDTALQLLLETAELDLHLLKDSEMLRLSLVPLLNQRTRLEESCRIKFEELLILLE